MKITKLKITNALGIESKELNPSDVQVISGANGKGKTSILEAIKMAFNNKGDKTEFVKRGENEACLYVETNNGLIIDRRKRTEKSDYLKIKGYDHGSEGFLKSLFFIEQFNPLDFLELSTKKQNAILLSLIEDRTCDEDFEKWFGEKPDFSSLENQHVLTRLGYLGGEKSPYYLDRHEYNRKKRYDEETAERLLSNKPENFDIVEAERINLSKLYTEIKEKDLINANIEKAEGIILKNQNEIEAIENKFKLKEKEELQFKDFKVIKIKEDIEKEIELINTKNELLKSDKEKLREKIRLLELEIRDDEKSIIENNSKIINLRENGVQERSKEIEAVTKTKLENLEKEKQKELINQSKKIELSKQYLENNEKIDVEALRKEAEEKEIQKDFVSTYKNAMKYIKTAKENKEKADKMEELIKLARSLPGQLLKDAELPISGLIIENGLVRIKNNNGEYVLIDGLSEGEKLNLCIDIAVAKAGELKVVLVDGFEKLDKNKQQQFIEKAKESGLQYFITEVSEGELTIKEY